MPPVDEPVKVDGRHRRDAGQSELEAAQTFFLLGGRAGADDKESAAPLLRQLANLLQHRIPASLRYLVHAIDEKQPAALPEHRMYPACRRLVHQGPHRLHELVHGRQAAQLAFAKPDEKRHALMPGHGTHSGGLVLAFSVCQFAQLLHIFQRPPVARVSGLIVLNAPIARRGHRRPTQECALSAACIPTDEQPMAARFQLVEYRSRRSRASLSFAAILRFEAHGDIAHRERVPTSLRGQAGPEHLEIIELPDHRFTVVLLVVIVLVRRIEARDTLLDTFYPIEAPSKLFAEAAHPLQQLSSRGLLETRKGRTGGYEQADGLVQRPLIQG